MIDAFVVFGIRVVPELPRRPWWRKLLDWWRRTSPLREFARGGRVTLDVDGRPIFNLPLDLAVERGPCLEIDLPGTLMLVIRAGQKTRMGVRWAGPQPASYAIGFQLDGEHYRGGDAPVRSTRTPEAEPRGDVSHVFQGRPSYFACNVCGLPERDPIHLRPAPADPEGTR